jgi:membrane associated rhomboid family serine protease
MIPIRDHNPSGSFPFVTYLLIAVNVLVFLYMLTLSQSGLDNFIYNFSLIPANIISGIQLYSIFSSMFLHGGFGHIVGNMLFLNIFGDNLEDSLGHLKFLLYYITAGIAGSLMQFILDPTSTIPNLGASGAIAGVMGGYLLLFPNHRIDILFSWGFFVERVALPAYSMLFYWFIFQLFQGFGQLAVNLEGGVAYAAHVGGFVFGYGILLPFKNLLLKDRPRFIGYF